MAREIARDELARHKLPHKRSSTPTPHTLASRHHFAPLNRYHPPSGLFVKDCNEQCTDDLVPISLLSSTTTSATI